jgi:hypothetical protein
LSQVPDTCPHAHKMFISRALIILLLPFTDITSPTEHSYEVAEKPIQEQSQK